MEAKVEYSRELINEAAMVYWWRTSSFTFFGSIAFIVLALALIFVFGYRDWITGTFLALAILSCIISVLVFFVYRARSLGVFEQMKESAAIWRFREGGFSVESDVAKSELKWGMVKGIIKSKNAWLVEYRNNTYSLFPLAGVSGDMLDFMSKKVLEHGGKVS